MTESESNVSIPEAVESSLMQENTLLKKENVLLKQEVAVEAEVTAKTILYPSRRS